MELKKVAYFLAGFIGILVVYIISGFLSSIIGFVSYFYQGLALRLIALLKLLVMSAPFAFGFILSVYFAKRNEKHITTGIIVALVVIVLWSFVLPFISATPFRERQVKIESYETFADLSGVGLGIYKIEEDIDILDRLNDGKGFYGI